MRIDLKRVLKNVYQTKGLNTKYNFMKQKSQLKVN